MKNILNKIIVQKKKEVEEKKKRNDMVKLRQKLKKSHRNFQKAISREKLSLIAEIKHSSPISGRICKEWNPLEIAKIYQKHAQAISVVTDETFFHGSLKYLKEIDAIAQIPLLCKDFIIDEYQIYEARSNGADAILLIAAILKDEEIMRFHDIARSMNMHALVEVHTEDEVQRVLKNCSKKNVFQDVPNIIGINNRNLKTFEIDFDTTLRLSKMIPKNCLIVSESGIGSRKDIEKLQGKVDAVLIGTAFMQSADIETQLEKFGF